MMTRGSTTPFVPLKYIAEIVSGGTPKSDPNNWDGDIPFITPPDLNGLDGDVVSQWERTLTKDGTSGSSITNDAVLLSCRAPIGHVGVVTSEVAFNQGCKSIVPQDADDLAYVAYCLVASRRALQALGRGTTFMELSTTELSNFSIPWPVFEDRCTIVRYLDRETGEIDAMLAKLDVLDEALNSRRASVVEREIISWSGRLTRLKFCADLSLGKTFQGTRKSDRETLVNYVRAASIQPRGLELDDQRMWMTQEELQKYSLRLGDVLIVEGGAAGRSVYIEKDMPGWGFQNHVIRVRPDEHHDGRFLNYCIKGHYEGGLIDILADGATISGLSSDKAKNLPIPDMSLEEQQRIADHLDEVTGRIDAMLATIDELKALLVERRAALITDVVTGRKKLPA